MKCCKDCKHFTDGHFSKTYISPTCTVRGTDSAAYMRECICGVDEARLWEPIPSQAHTVADGKRPEQDTCATIRYAPTVSNEGE